MTTRCVHIITSVHSDPMRRGNPCERPAKHTNEKGEPACGYHEPVALARRKAHNPFVASAGVRVKGGYASAKKRWGFEKEST